MSCVDRAGRFSVVIVGSTVVGVAWLSISIGLLTEPCYQVTQTLNYTAGIILYINDIPTSPATLVPSQTRVSDDSLEGAPAVS